MIGVKETLMNRKSASAIIIILSIIVAASLYVYLESNTISGLVVPDNYPTIQSAIDAASSGNTIHVKSGTYNENLVIDKQITLIGENRANTIITAETDNPTITITTNNVTVTGFTISGSNTGVYIVTDNCTLTNNTIEDCSTGIYTNSSTESRYYINIIDNTVKDNAEAGIIFEGKPFMFNVTGNTITGNGYGVRATDSYRCLIQNNTITANNVGVDAAGIRLDIMNNNLTDNTETAITIRNIPTETSDIIRIFYNTIQNSKQGLNIIQGSRHSIIQNTINNCTTAINFNQTKNRGWITENNITNNTNGLSITESNQNIYENNLIDNTHQAIIDANSTIDWDSQQKGNYWSDYTTRYPQANQIDDTGVWDTPYQIDSNNTDQYPLVNPYTNILGS
jgi:parallel beta-helix repeat protein